MKAILTALLIAVSLVTFKGCGIVNYQEVYAGDKLPTTIEYKKDQ